MIDHLVYGAPELASAVARLEEILGVAAAAGGRHEGRGTHNALLALGDDTYLEVIAPDPSQPEPSGPRPFGLDHLTERRLVTFAVHAANRPEDLDHQSAPRQLEGWRRRALQHGYDPGPVKTGGRRRLNGTELSWHLCQHIELPFGGAVPFLIDWGPTRSPALTAPAGCRLLELEVGHPQPEAVRATLRALGVAVPVRSNPAPLLQATLTTPRGRVVLT